MAKLLVGNGKTIKELESLVKKCRDKAKQVSDCGANPKSKFNAKEYQKLGEEYYSATEDLYLAMIAVTLQEI